MQKLKQQQLFDRVFDRLPDHVTLLLIIISGFLLARLTWMMFPSDPSISAALTTEQVADTGVSVIQAHATSKNLGAEIAGYHLLGVYTPPPPPVVVQPAPAPVVEAPPPPPKPREKLELVGVYALSEKEGIAIISAQGKQEVVGLGEVVGKTTATLKNVYANRVDVSWEGEIETLEMPNIDRSALGAIQDPEGQQLQPDDPVVQEASFDQIVGAVVNDAVVNESVPDPLADQPTDVVDQVMPTDNPLPDGSDAGSLQNEGVVVDEQVALSARQGGMPVEGSPAASLSAFKQEIINNNINLLQVIRPSPRRENGQLIGFAVKPGTNRALFNQTGLKSGDVVTAINGMPLNNNSASRQAMQGLASSSGASLTVLRGGQETMVQLSF